MPLLVHITRRLKKCPSSSLEEQYAKDRSNDENEVLLFSDYPFGNNGDRAKMGEKITWLRTVVAPADWEAPSPGQWRTTTGNFLKFPQDFLRFKSPRRTKQNETTPLHTTNKPKFLNIRSLEPLDQHCPIETM